MKIKFKKYFRPEEGIRGVTPRRLSAARRALKYEQEKLPLFAELIAEKQPSPEERIKMFDDGTVESTKEDRKRRADKWRRARKMLRDLSADDRAGLLEWWNRPVYPCDPEFLLDLIRQWTFYGWRPPFYGEDVKKKWDEGRVKVAKLFDRWRAEGRIKGPVGQEAKTTQ